VSDGKFIKEIKWTFDTGNPVIPPGRLHGKLDVNRVASASVIQCEKSYRLYYWGTGEDNKNRILMAESQIESPNDWKSLGAVLEAQKNNEYNCVGPGFPFVMQIDEKVWFMYFCGWGRPREDEKIPNTTGLAISEDGGITWKYQSDKPVIPCDSGYDSCGTGSVYVFRESGKFRMYYTAISKYFNRPEGVQTGHGDVIPFIGIGYAISDDGINWKKPYDHWLIKPREFDTEPYEYICSKPWIVRENGAYRMWVNTFGTAYRVRSLVSNDGLSWKWVQSGEMGDMAVGEAGAFDDTQRCYATVMKHGDQYRCWYTGNGFGVTGIGFATGHTQK